MSEKPRPVYQGEGWIEAGDMQVGVQSARGYARPDAGSERLLDLKGDWLRDRVALRGIVACDGEWLLLDYEMRNDEKLEPLAPKDRKRGRAWFRGICGSEETSCDMRSADRSGPAARRFAALVHASSSSRSRCVTDVSRASLGASQLRRSSM